MADVGNATMADSPETVKSRDKVHHTVTACVRCRQRKTRCDPTLPRCEPCERSNAHCEYYDSAKNRTIPRTYITSLQETVRRLNEEYKALEKEDDYEPDHESMARAAGLVRFTEKDECRFLGPSSGIAITRFVMEFAKQNSSRRMIKDVVPHHAAQEIKDKFDAESSKPTSKVYPLISSVAAPDLPNRELMERLVSIYMVKAQYMLPLLHEPSFRRDLETVYNGTADTTLNFQVRLVVAISMQKLDKQYAGLADSYYLAALPFMPGAVEKMDLSTLQCFALIAQYSLLTPTRTAAYWVVGVAAKLCQDLGLCEEETIHRPPNGSRPNALEIDMRRRLFWIITSMEYGLSHSLGRPSAFGVTVDNINVNFFELCDDRFISADGLLPGHHPIMKKCISIHFLKMRLLQAEIRRTLYLRKRDTPTSDTDPWFHQMLKKIDDWVRDCPKNDEGSGLSETWFIGRKNTMIVFMYRPSPQIPTPSLEAAQKCYSAAIFNIQMQKRQAEANLIDITWIFTQAIFMALNTVLWCLSYPSIRQQHTIEEAQMHIQDALTAIDLCADRWPGVRSAQQLYENLVLGCLKAYDADKTGESPATSDYVSTTTQDISSSASGFANSPASTANTSLYGAQSPQSIHSVHTAGTINQTFQPQQASSGYNDQSKQPQSYQPENVHQTSQPQNLDTQYIPHNVPRYDAQSMIYSLPGFDPHAAANYINTTQGGTPWTSAAMVPGVIPGINGSPDTNYDDLPYLAPFGQEYSRYMHQSFPPTYQMQSLSRQQQMELMASLEQSQLPDVSNLVSDATTFYTAALP
ncbi:fungal-specific transcription factor domain-containing protein [Exophiala viscosa]|uniref:Fungal-specific transcription factor domain-containing protein n=1 Tax=Exophiala viscosa TaxID=2486360 RepID=A0AAN6E2G6_9EURO|nr:fungal-specific transcription factor domain-containing protein [Exophiala viscosa]KAI1629464.1 fungal-specific transcription factor domain-containing protein [Exophiala viscosa]